MTLSEVLVSSSLAVMLAGALMISAISLQRSYSAADHYSASQAAQARLADFLDVDFRRATSMTVGNNGHIVELTLPGYYAPDGSIRMPSPEGRHAQYGTNSDQVTVTYDQALNSIVRTEVRPTVTYVTTVASDVQDFEVQVAPINRTADVSVTFIPKFSWITSGNTLREGTTFTSHTYLRNLR